VRSAATIAAAVTALAVIGCSGSEPEPADAGPKASSTAKPNSKAKPQKFRVARIVDGDTIDVAGGKRVRLVQIDTPESDGECYGDKATEVLSRLLPVGTKVMLERDPRLDNVDRYGRILRYVIKGDTNVNLVLVRHGAASVWFYDGDRGRYAHSLAAAARKARDKGRGGWDACTASFDFARAWELSEKTETTTNTEAAEPTCHPSYTGACLDPNASDYDCADGEGDGPLYTGVVKVVGDDVYDLDRDGDGIGCESD
jgi:endonuclease YncB( thermonuclease family)